MTLPVGNVTYFDSTSLTRRSVVEMTAMIYRFLCVMSDCADEQVDAAYVCYTDSLIMSTGGG